MTCKASITQSALEGRNKVSVVDLNLGNIPDEMIDIDVLPLRQYFDSVAWKHLHQISKPLSLFSCSLSLQSNFFIIIDC